MDSILVQFKPGGAHFVEPIRYELSQLHILTPNLRALEIFHTPGRYRVELRWEDWDSEESFDEQEELRKLYPGLVWYEVVKSLEITKFKVNHWVD
jgi:hypothetical protein